MEFIAHEQLVNIKSPQAAHHPIKIFLNVGSRVVSNSEIKRILCKSFVESFGAFPNVFNGCIFKGFSGRVETHVAIDGGKPTLFYQVGLPARHRAKDGGYLALA